MLNQLKKKLKIVYIIDEVNARIYRHYSNKIKKHLLLIQLVLQLVLYDPNHNPILNKKNQGNVNTLLRTITSARKCYIIAVSCEYSFHSLVLLWIALVARHRTGLFVHIVISHMQTKATNKPWKHLLLSAHRQLKLQMFLPKQSWELIISCTIVYEN